MSLPATPVGWADVATKQDLRALEAALRGEIAVLRGELHHELGLVRSDMAHQTRTFVLSVAGLMVAGAGVALATAQLVS